MGLFGTNLGSFRGIMSLFGPKALPISKMVSFLCPNLNPFLELVSLFGPTFTPIRELVSLFEHRYGSVLGACLPIWAQIWGQYGSFCHFLGPNLDPFREFVSLFGSKFWAQSGCGCHSLGPNLGSFRELVSFSGRNLAPIREIVSVPVAKLGHVSGTCVTSWAEIWSRLGASLSFGPKCGPILVACVTFRAQI